MDRLVAMQVYRSVVSYGSFSQAAKALRISTASASRNVSDLERYLGTTLLRRSTRNLLLTDVGKAYYGHCCEILDRIGEVEDLAGQAKTELHGRLRVSMPTAFGVRYIAPLLPQFIQRYPDIEVDVWCSDQFVDFNETGFDVAIRVTRAPDDKLIARWLAPMRCAAVAAPSYIASHGAPEFPDELRKHNCLSYAYASYGDLWRFFRGGIELAVPVRSVFRSNCGEVIRLASVGGQGIALLPTFLVEEHLQNGELVELFADYRFCDYGVYAVYPVDCRNSMRTGVFVEFMRESFAAAACFS